MGWSIGIPNIVGLTIGSCVEVEEYYFTTADKHIKPPTRIIKGVLVDIKEGGWATVKTKEGTKETIDLSEIKQISQV